MHIKLVQTMKKLYTILGLLVMAKFSFAQLIITGVYDGTLTGGQPKGIELYASADIADLSIYGIESINSAMDGSTGIEFTFPADAVASGTTLFLTGSSDDFQDFFGVAADYEDSGSMSINGDDPVALYKDGSIIDVFGVIGTDGSGEPWEYLDGWASRNPGTSASSSFNLADWTLGGVDALEGGSNNATATNPYPLARYGGGLPPDVTVGVTSNVFTPKDITINVGETVEWENTQGRHNVNGTQSTYPSNPESFGNGGAALAPWTYRHTFTIPGVYNYQCDPHVGFNMVGTVTVMGETISYPSYDIVTVSSVDENGVADSLETTCTLTGIVHGVNLREGGLAFSLIDENNNGIAVFSNSEDFGYTVNEGDVVRLEGEIDQFRGLTQLVPISVMVTGSASPVDAKIVTDLVEDDESSLLNVEEFTVDSVGPEQFSGRNIIGTSAGNEIVVRINSATDVSLDAFEVGETYSVTGLGGQFDQNEPFDEGYQLVPRRSNDVSLISSIEQIDLSNEIKLFPTTTQDFVRYESMIQLDQISVFSVTGQKVMSIESPARNAVIDFVDHTSGTYVVQFITEKGQWSTRVIKQ